MLPQLLDRSGSTFSARVGHMFQPPDPSVTAPSDAHRVPSQIILSANLFPHGREHRHRLLVAANTMQKYAQTVTSAPQIVTPKVCIFNVRASVAVKQGTGVKLKGPMAIEPLSFRTRDGPAYCPEQPRNDLLRTRETSIYHT